MKYFERVKPTFIENWPNALKALSFADVDIPLSLEEARALGTNIQELGESFIIISPEQKALQEAADEQIHRRMAASMRKQEFMEAIIESPKIEWKPSDISSIGIRASEAATKFPDGFFPRLGSRSAKDAFWPKRDQRAYSGAEALDILCAASERIHDDLLMALKEDYCPHIFFRQWMPIQKWQEFRCFMRGRKLVGMSQYSYHETYPEIADNEDRVRFGIEQFFRTFKDACHIEDAVFDVWVKILTVGNESAIECKLIEINPFFELTDPCLFDWHHPEEMNGQLRFKP